MSRGLEAKLDALSRLRDEPDPEVVGRALSKALAAKTSNLMAARAAKVAAALGRADLEEAMVAAFDRLLVDATRRDKGCLGKTALAKALVELDCAAGEVFRAGAEHVQLEPTWGGSVDTAIELRSWCAQGLADAALPDAVLRLVPLLVDSEHPPRLAAARALGGSGRLEAEAVLRLKVLGGDSEPEVLGECFASLLHLEPRRSLEFVVPFLDHEDKALAQSAALALGECRHEDAVPPLVSAVARVRDQELRQTLCLALALSRRPAALDTLLDWLAEGDDDLALLALRGLLIHRHDRALQPRIETAVEASGSSRLRRVFEEA